MANVMSFRLRRIVTAAAAPLLLIVVAGAATAAVASPTFTVRDAVAVIGVVPQHPTSDVPFQPSGRGSSDLREMMQNPGDCGSGMPADVCRRWAAGIHRARFVGAPERF